MENEHNNSSIKKNIFEAIKAGRLSMRPKWHFILQTILAVLGITLVSLTLLYLVSFIISALRESGAWFVPIFGSRGWFEFFASLPWILVIIAILFIVVLEILVRRFSFGNRQPLLYTAVAIIFLMLIGGALVVPFHRGLFRAAEEQRLPLVGEFYRGYGTPRVSNTHLGVIFETTKDGFVMEERNNEQLHIVVSSQTRFPLGTEFSVGDAVVVFGNRSGDTIHALGIRQVSNDFGSSTMRMLRPGSRRNLQLQWGP